MAIKYNPYNWEIKPRKNNKKNLPDPIINIKVNEKKLMEEIRQAIINIDNIVEVIFE